MYFGGYVFRNESFVFRNMDCLYTLLRSFPVGVFATEGRGRVRVSGALKVSMFHVEQLSRLPYAYPFVIP